MVELVAMRQAGTLFFLLSDHLGGTNVTVTTAGVEYSEVRYKAFGEQRYSSGTTPTTYRYTGQRVEQSIGLYYYGARWYDSTLGRFTSPDSIIPAQQGVMGNDRYAYVNNSPLNFIDPSGHFFQDPKQFGYMHDYDEAPKLMAEQSSTEPPSNEQLDQWTWLDTMDVFNNQTTPLPVCPAPRVVEGPTLEETLAFIRLVAGEVDPFIPGAFTGTNLTYTGAIRESVQALSSYTTIDPTLVNIITPYVPLAAATFDFVYDQATGTGEYSNIKLTPLQYVILFAAVFIVIPGLPPF